jgi:hypothetical protein
MSLLRNLLYNSPADVDAALAWSGGALLAAARAAAARPGEAPALREHALYVAVNAASSASPHKGAVVEAGWPAALVAALGDGCEAVREAAVWGLINLSWGGDAGDAGADARRAALRELGAEAALEALAPEASQAVHERARVALRQFRPPAAGGGGEGEGEEGAELPGPLAEDEGEEFSEDEEMLDTDEVAEFEIDEQLEPGDYF